MANSKEHSFKLELDKLLVVLFIALKLTHQIDWPWVWVLAPMWITWLLVIFIALIIASLSHFSK